MMSNILILLMFTAVVGIGLYWLLWGNWDKRNIDAYDGLVMSLFEEKIK